MNVKTEISWSCLHLIDWDTVFLLTKRGFCLIQLLNTLYISAKKVSIEYPTKHTQNFAISFINFYPNTFKTFIIQPNKSPSSIKYISFPTVSSHQQSSWIFIQRTTTRTCASQFAKCTPIISSGTMGPSEGWARQRWLSWFCRGSNGSTMKLRELCIVCVFSPVSGAPSSPPCSLHGFRLASTFQRH